MYIVMSGDFNIKRYPHPQWKMAQSLVGYTATQICDTAMHGWMNSNMQVADVFGVNGTLDWVCGPLHDHRVLPAKRNI